MFLFLFLFLFFVLFFVLFLFFSLLIVSKKGNTLLQLTGFEYLITFLLRRLPPAEPPTTLPETCQRLPTTSDDLLPHLHHNGCWIDPCYYFHELHAIADVVACLPSSWIGANEFYHFWALPGIVWSPFPIFIMKSSKDRLIPAWIKLEDSLFHTKSGWSNRALKLPFSGHLCNQKLSAKMCKLQ